MKFSVTALTPLLVGDGRELSPIDYMVWKDQVNVLDQTRIFKLLARGPRLEGYLGQLRKASKLDFASWGGFAQNFSQRRIPFEHPEATAIWNSAPAESLFIPTFAANHRGAYLPASAVKGALRTGVVFSRWSAATIDRVAASMEGDRVPRRAGETAESASGASRVKAIALGDSDPVPATAFKIFVTRVASLDMRQSPTPQLAWKVAGRGSVPASRVSDATPVFAEMAVPGTSFSGDLAWRSVPDPGLFMGAANQYAAAQLDLHARYAEMTGLSPLHQTVLRLKSELAAAQASPAACLLCLGWGAGFISKAGFLGTDQAGYRKILRAVPSIGKAVREGLPFPKTRRVVFEGGQPATLPGWVRVQFQQ
ncbi:MAG: hypothetical protein WB992_16290 [Bryobacteraceae bacterium]